MKPIPRATIIIAFLLSVPVCSIAQPTSPLTTADKVFSPIAIKAAKEKLTLFNRYGTTKTALAIFVFHLPAVELRITYEKPKSGEKKNLGELIKVAEDPIAVEKNKSLFLDLAALSDKKAKDAFDKNKSKGNLLFINVHLGYAYKNESEGTHPYYNYSILGGDNVRSETKKELTLILDSFKSGVKQFGFSTSN